MVERTLVNGKKENLFIFLAIAEYHQLSIIKLEIRCLTVLEVGKDSCILNVELRVNKIISHQKYFSDNH